MYKERLKSQLLLDSLVGKILPALIVSDPRKADEILAYMKKTDTTLSKFLKKYPEYEDIELNHSLDVTRTLDSIKDDEGNDFLPLANFNHEIFKILTDIIKERNILPIREDLDYQFQLRLSLYRNFNRYLNILINRLDDRKAELLCRKLLDINDGEKFFELISARLDESSDDIINNFFNLGKK
jgi:hypothetical protein